MTIFSKSNAFPVAIGGSKTVKTFPSGLVLVTQEYAVPRGQEETYAAAFALGQPLAVDSPAIDGLYIHPEPEWRDSGDGFTRLTVSAYGRTTTAITSRTEFVTGETTIQRDTTTAESSTSTTGTANTLNESVVRSFVKKTSDPFSLESGIANNVLKVYWPDGRTLFEVFPPGTNTGGGIFNSTTTSTYAALGGVSTNNFGYFSEVVITFVAKGEVSIVISSN